MDTFDYLNCALANLKLYCIAFLQDVLAESNCIFLSPLSKTHAFVKRWEKVYK